MKFKKYLQCAVLFIVFMVLMGHVIYFSIQHVRLAFYGIQTDATVIEIVRAGSSSARAFTGSKTYQFTTETGRDIEVKIVLLKVGGQRVGETVPIIYLSSHPEIVSAPGIIGYLPLFYCLFVAFVSGLLCWVSCVNLREW